MLPISLLKSGAGTLPVSSVSVCYCGSGAGTGGLGQRLSVVGVKAYQGRSNLSLWSRSPKTEEVEKLAQEQEAGNVVTELVKKEEDESALIIDRGPLPMITKRKLEYMPYGRTPRQAWVENLDTVQEKKLGLVDLHPDVFGTFPRLNLIDANVKWQQKYKTVDWRWEPTRGEVHGPNSKPWPQKGMGKSRHGDRRSPIWKGGGRAHGPRGPKTYFWMLNYYTRVHGLTSTLSVKLAQDDLKIVDTLDLPTSNPQHLLDLVSERHWGVSCLFIDDTDIVSKNIALATDSISHMNIMPVYGLNVFSMLKHETLVLTLAALNKIEERLILALNRHECRPPTARKFRAGFF